MTEPWGVRRRRRRRNYSQLILFRIGRFLLPLRPGRVKRRRISSHDQRAPSPIRKDRCQFFFSVYGCRFGDCCKFRHFTRSPTVDLRDNDGDFKNDLAIICLSPSFFLDAKNRYGTGPHYSGDTITLMMDIEASWINIAREESMRQIGNSNCVQLEIKDHVSNANMKSLHLIGQLNDVSDASEEINQFQSRQSLFCRLLRMVEPAHIPKSKFEGKKQLRWPGYSVFRMLISTVVAHRMCINGLRTNIQASLKLIKGETQSIALVYAKEQPGCQSHAIRGLLHIFDCLLKDCASTTEQFSVELLIEKEQACGFFGTESRSIEMECNCTLFVRVADGIGQRDLILEVFGGISNLREALRRIALYFQSFVVDKCMIPLIETLMENRLAEKPVGASILGDPSPTCIYRVESYYVAVALIGEGNTILSKIEYDSGVMISLEEVTEDPEMMMIYVSGNQEGVLSADNMVKKFLGRAAAMMGEFLLICRADNYSKKT